MTLSTQTQCADREFQFGAAAAALFRFHRIANAGRSAKRPTRLVIVPAYPRRGDERQIGWNGNIRAIDGDELAPGIAVGGADEHAGIDGANCVEHRVRSRNPVSTHFYDAGDYGARNHSLDRSAAEFVWKTAGRTGTACRNFDPLRKKSYTKLTQSKNQASARE